MQEGQLLFLEFVEKFLPSDRLEEFRAGLIGEIDLENAGLDAALAALAC